MKPNILPQKVTTIDDTHAFRVEPKTPIMILSKSTVEIYVEAVWSQPSIGTTSYMHAESDTCFWMHLILTIPIYNIAHFPPMSPCFRSIHGRTISFLSTMKNYIYHFISPLQISP